jgi:ATP-dependent RNA helicase DDX24/MAK5
MQNIRKGTRADPDKDHQNTLDELCSLLRFRSSNPKVIDLTEEARMPDTLTEKAVRCTTDEKDLYMYYYMTRK